MKQRGYTLVINLSLRSIRTIVFNEQGVKVFEDWLPVRTYINGLRVEQDPNEWWSLLKELLAAVFMKSSFGHKISSLTVTSSSLCLVGVDAKGEPIGKSLMASDKRAIVEAKDIQERFAKEFINHPEWKADASYLLPKILWLRRHLPKEFEKCTMFLPAKDFLTYKLCGKFITDDFNSEKFYYDKEKEHYPSDILTFVGIGPSRLPKVVPPGTIIGTIRSELRKKCSIPQHISVSLSTYDAICALIGSSTYAEGELNNVCGTCSSYRIMLDTKTERQSTKLLYQSFPSEDRLIVGGSNDLEGGVLEWAKECFYAEGYPKDDSFLYQLMEQEARESELGANGLIFMPYLIGERVPFADAYVRGMFFGMERFHSRKDIIRSIFEATALQAKLMLDEFQKSGIEVHSINMSGGVAKLSLAAQIRADVLGIPVNVLEEVETTAVGAFILTQKARKKISSIRDGRKLVKVHKQYIPNMHNHNCYASLFMLYKDLYAANSSLFKKRHDVFERVMHYQKKVLENL